MIWPGMIPLNSLWPLSSKFILHCLLWNNESGPCKRFFFATWQDVKLCQERVLEGPWRRKKGFSSRFWGPLLGSLLQYAWLLQHQVPVAHAASAMPNSSGACSSLVECHWHGSSYEGASPAPAPLWVLHSLSELLCHSALATLSPTRSGCQPRRVVVAPCIWYSYIL